MFRTLRRSVERLNRAVGTGRHRTAPGKRRQIGWNLENLEQRVVPASFPIGTFSGSYSDTSFYVDENTGQPVYHQDSGVITMTLYVTDPVEGFLGGSVTITGYPQGTLTLPVDEGIDQLQPDGFFSVAFQYPYPADAEAPAIHFSIEGYSHDPDSFDVSSYELDDGLNNPGYSTYTPSLTPIVLTPGPGTLEPDSLVVHLSTPSAIAPGDPGEATIDYTNVGSTTLTAPLLTLSTDAGNATFNLPGQPDEGTAIDLVAGNPGGSSFGSLPPGFSNTITVDFTPTTSDPLQFTLDEQSNPDEPFDWQVIASNVPPDEDEADWSSVVQAAQGSIGSTWGDVLNTIDTSVSAVPDAEGDAIPEGDTFYDFASLLPYLTITSGPNGDQFAGDATPAIATEARPSFQVTSSSTIVPDVYDPKSNTFNAPPGFTTYGSIQGQAAVYYLGPLSPDGITPAPNPSHTYIISHGWHGLDNNNSRFIQLARTIQMVDSNAAIYVSDWTPGASTADPWQTALNINASADAAAVLLLPLVQNGTINPQNTTFIGESFGNDFNARLDDDFETETHSGAVGSALIFNPANNLGGYHVPNFEAIYAHSYAFITSSIADESNVTANAVLSIQDLPPGLPFENPVDLHTHGVVWLQQLLANQTPIGLMWLQLSVPIQQGSPFDGTANFDGTYTPPSASSSPQTFVPVVPIPNGLNRLGTSTTFQGAIPPNSLTGPGGQGDDQEVGGDQALPYTIAFNGAPVDNGNDQTATITDQFGPAFDPGTFEFGDVNIGGTDVAIPPNVTSYSDAVDTMNTLGTDVQLSTSISLSTGTATWTMTDTGAETGAVALASAAAASAGVRPLATTIQPLLGSIHFTIKPKAGTSSGTVLSNQAAIVFGTAAAIQTDATANTIDADPPTSSVLPLPTTSSSSTITLAWSGQDNPGGSGIARFDIFVSDNNGPFTPFLTGTTQTTASFDGQSGHTYGFYSVAIDNVGNIQATPAVAQATTTINLASPTPTPTPTPSPSTPTPPHVVGKVSVSKTKQGLTSFTIPFDEPLNPSSATNPGLYHVFAAIKKHGKTVSGKALKIRRVSYSPNSQSVTVTLTKSYRGTLQVTIESGLMAANNATSNVNISLIVA